MSSEYSISAGSVRDAPAHDVCLTKKYFIYSVAICAYYCLSGLISMLQNFVVN